ncbi:MAG TPA: thiamine pyrophosphate-dependent enzyme [Chloroflexota bacterium]|nr:thiamine pyrophosphate-dependent enzyme [Chloroflexota bacterium]
MNRFECLPLLAEMLEEHTLTVTSLSSNARIWAGVWDRGPTFAGLNMGLCIGFALGLSLAFPHRKVVALESDGSMMEDTSVLISVADANPTNLVILVFDNESYARMGATATARGADLVRMAQGAGIRSTGLVRTLPEYERAVRDALAKPGPTFLQIKVEAETARVPDSRTTYGPAMKEQFLDRVLSHPDYRGWHGG